MQLRPDEPLEHKTVVLYLQVKDGAGYVDSTHNLANFTRWTLDARPQQLKLAFMMVHMIQHGPCPNNANFSVVVRSDPHRSATNQSRVLGQLFTCWCRKLHCRRCSELEGDIGFGWIGPWTCGWSIRMRPDRTHELCHLVRGDHWCWCPNCFNRVPGRVPAIQVAKINSAPLLPPWLLRTTKRSKRRPSSNGLRLLSRPKKRQPIRPKGQIAATAVSHWTCATNQLSNRASPRASRVSKT